MYLKHGTLYYETKTVNVPISKTTENRCVCFIKHPMKPKYTTRRYQK